MYMSVSNMYVYVMFAGFVSLVPNPPGHSYIISSQALDYPFRPLRNDIHGFTVLIFSAHDESSVIFYTVLYGIEPGLQTINDTADFVCF